MTALCEVIDQIGADDDQNKRDGAFWFSGSVGLACGKAVGRKSVAKQIVIHVYLPFVNPG